MQTVKCENCGQQFPMNETFRINAVVLCRVCGEQAASEQKDIDIKSVKQQIDPTICFNCGKDHNQQHLPMLAGLPVCLQCETFFRHRPFPHWVKVFLFIMFALVACALVWNIRFIQAYVEMRSSVRAFYKNDLEKAAELMDSASAHVPENSELLAMAALYQSILLLGQDRPAEALEVINSCRSSSLPQGLNETLDQLAIAAEIGVAFDNKDYDRFLAMAIENYNINPDDVTNCGQVASAYACKFAVTGDEQFRKKSLEILDKAKTLSKADPYFSEYERRILHRLYSREIITRSEFQKRFPDGWKEPAKE